MAKDSMKLKCDIKFKEVSQPQNNPSEGKSS